MTEGVRSEGGSGSDTPPKTVPPTRAAALAWARSLIPSSEARQLLRQLLNCTTAHLLAWSERGLEAEQWQAFVDQVRRRAAGEPLAYLLGECEFYGRPFAVSPAVLIPRHDTELLVELALERLPSHTPARVLDLGCGSGVLAVTLALERPQAQVVALDASLAALEVAQGNAARLQAQVDFIHSDWFERVGRVSGEQGFALIVSNPPYIAADDPHLSQGDLRFEPHRALAAGERGLDDLERIIGAAPHYLRPSGCLLLEHGHEQGAAVRDLLIAAGFRDVASWRDLGGNERVSGGIRAADQAAVNVGQD